MTFGPMQVRPGMEVVATAGTAVGRVKEARTEDFVVERPEQGDAVIPYEAIRAMLGDQVVISLRPDELTSE
jgi:sporulation protein YlmC with PRC-barrel domain